MKLRTIFCMLRWQAITWTNADPVHLCIYKCVCVCGGGDELLAGGQLGTKSLPKPVLTFYKLNP